MTKMLYSAYNLTAIAGYLVLYPYLDPVRGANDQQKPNISSENTLEDILLIKLGQRLNCFILFLLLYEESITIN